MEGSTKGTFQRERVIGLMLQPEWCDNTPSLPVPHRPLPYGQRQRQGGSGESASGVGTAGPKKPSLSRSGSKTAPGISCAHEGHD
eukprot:29642-Pelagococcus_subviridis.AAC.17